MRDDDHVATTAALEHLRDALRALVQAAEASMGARCPHRIADDVCTFPAECENQRPGTPDGEAPRRCAGDRDLDWGDGPPARIS